MLLFEICEFYLEVEGLRFLNLCPALAVAVLLPSQVCVTCQNREGIRGTSHLNLNVPAGDMKIWVLWTSCGARDCIVPGGDEIQIVVLMQLCNISCWGRGRAGCGLGITQDCKM